MPAADVNAASGQTEQPRTQNFIVGQKVWVDWEGLKALRRRQGRPVFGSPSTEKDDSSDEDIRDGIVKSPSTCALSTMPDSSFLMAEITAAPHMLPAGKKKAGDGAKANNSVGNEQTEKWAAGIRFVDPTIGKSVGELECEAVEEDFISPR